MSPDWLLLCFTIAASAGGLIWRMSGLFARVDAIQYQLKRLNAHITSELGGRNEDGILTPGNQATIRDEKIREVRSELVQWVNDRFDALRKEIGLET